VVGEQLTALGLLDGGRQFEDVDWIVLQGADHDGLGRWRGRPILACAGLRLGCLNGNSSTADAR
jgi:hypothetical protein